jgi:putative SOS response-associated peptidase YedK
MCGRFTLAKAPREVAHLFQLAEPPDILKPRYNIAPSQKVAAVALKGDGVTRGLALLKWGLVPSRASDPKAPPHPINARAEGIDTKAMFADLIEARRCLIPADGYYEWTGEGKKKTPHHIRMKDGSLFAFAGLWDVWKRDGQLIASCAIITTAAPESLRHLHDRAPVILPPGEYSRWLDPAAGTRDVTGLLTAHPGEALEAVRVGPAVGKVTYDGPECLTPAA